MSTIISGNSPTSIGDDTTINGDITADNLPTNGSIVGYQQGVWTPAWKNLTSGDGSPTYAYRNGWWTRVGNLVTAQFIVTITDKGDLDTDSACLYGLPYAAMLSLPDLDPTGQQSYVGVSYYNTLINPPTDKKWVGVTGYVPVSESRCRFYALKDDGSATGLKYSQMDDNSSWRGQASYLTDNTTWTPINGATIS